MEEDVSRKASSSILFLLWLMPLYGVPGCHRPAESERQGNFVRLFNGRDLSGWDGDPRFWSVEGGAITGRTTPANRTDENTFLIWRGREVSDFELRLKVRIRGNNSGIQYRSRDMGNWVVHGYQCDLGAGGPRHYGKLSEEKGRRWLAEAGQKVRIDPDGSINVIGKVGDSDVSAHGIPEWQWVDVIVIARGDHLVHKINGVTTADVVDRHSTASSRRGILALQIHSGDPMAVQFKDIRLSAPPPLPAD